MASVRRRGAHQYQARIRLKGYPRLEKTFTTRAAADHWARTTTDDLHRRGPGDHQAPALTLTDALRRYGAEVTPLKKSAQHELGRVRGWLRNALAVRPLADIAPKDLALWRDLRVSNGIAANTIRLDLALLSHVFEVARKDWGYTTLLNPTKVIRKPKLPRGRDRRLSADEERALLAHCARVGAHQLSAAITLAVETAMRRSELLALRWNDVDLHQRLARLHDTKNGEARTVPLSTRAVAVLQSLPRLNARILPLHPDSVTWAFHKARAACHIDGLRFHDLRHEATSRLFERGLNMMEVSTITGHKSLQMLKRYTHLRAADLVARLR